MGIILILVVFWIWMMAGCEDEGVQIVFGICGILFLIAMVGSMMLGGF